MAEENTGTAGGAAQTEPTETTNADTAATPEGAATMLTDGAATPTDESAAKPEGSTEGETQTDTKQEPEGAPDVYEPFTDGETQYSVEQVQAFADTAKELGLSQEKAQRLFSAMRPSAEQFMQAEHTARVAQWRADAEGDAEFGGDALKENLAVAKSALNAFASDQLRQMLEVTGLGNHPEIIRLFVRIGKETQQDPGVGGSAAKREEPRRRFPNSEMVEDT